ncbi:CoA pyrophosphatase [Stieleria sp. ICT_E10.1]|uniref:NUDIX hydrolase n=1 Tax=Stieleria sedimenti TaxID=2976331 RepID=UPI00217F7704|nr:CoA pyrophosphatase [Stieleria sedimenti]MCS7468017.1 CoA pyrophosphatase [Stieleria sedimenti]
MSARDRAAEQLFAAESIKTFGSVVAQVLAQRSGNAGKFPSGQFLYRSIGSPRTRGGSKLAPRLSYGRHRGPARSDSRQAAVVIVVYPHRQTGRLCLTLTRRPKALSHHGGQVCLPGGQIESGESSLQAALREYQEELGLPVEVIDVVGCLSPIYVFASDNLVDTQIVTAQSPIAQSPTADWRPDPVEVDEVIEMPLECLLHLGEPGAPHSAPHCTLIDQKKQRIGKSQGSGEVFQYRFGHRAIEFEDCLGRRRDVWGATAMLLGEFAEIVACAVEHWVRGVDKRDSR